MNNWLFIVFLTLLAACGGGSSSKSVTSPEVPPAENTIVVDNIAIPNNTLAEHYKVLLIGNSHVSVNNLPAIIERLIAQGKPQSEVTVTLAGGLEFLDDRENDGYTLQLIESERWTHTILQGQKYSQSRSKKYPTDAAENWIKVLKHQQSTPIMFPEHPQRGDLTEAKYIHDIHLAIKENQQTCVAPIGLGWNKVITDMPELTMHAVDGNHAAYAGSFFTALIFYQVITGELADALPYIEQVPLAESVQTQLGEIASQILDEHQACEY